MLKYYRLSDPSDVRDLNEQMQQWIEANNPKAQEWVKQPLSPDSAAQWINGEWIVSPTPTFTAEEIVSQYFSPYQIAALQRFEFALMQAGKPLGPAMTAAKTWLESVMLGWAVDPTSKPAAAYGVPNVTFEQASAEAVSNLNPEP